MTQTIMDFFSATIPDRYLLAALLAVIPVTEIKGSILFSAATGADPVLSFLSGFGASVLLAILLSFLFPFVIGWAERSERIRHILAFLTSRLDRKANRLRSEQDQMGGKSKALFGVYAFVALPLPLTGIWAGALLAAILHLDRGRTLFALTAGNFTAGGIVLAIALFAGERAESVLNLFLLLAATLLVFTLLRSFLSKKKQKI